MASKKIIVIGAGMVGLNTAYYLNQRGHDVTVYDSSDGNSNCSMGNAGFFCPSHVVPLASPGIISQGIKWMFDSKSPFYIKPRVNRDLINWGLKFKKAANPKQALAAAPLLHYLTTRSQELIETIFETESIDAGYTKNGLLMLCQTEEELHHEKETAELAKTFGQKAEVLSKEEAQNLNGGMEMNIKGAVYFPGDTSFSPHIFIRNFKELLVSKGVKVNYHSKVTSIAKDGSKLTGINIGDQFIAAEEVVIATGSWAGSFTKHLGLSLPMQGGKGYSFKVDKPEVMPTVPAILCEGKVSMSPMLNGIRFSGTMEINGEDLSINHNRIEGIINAATSFLPQFTKEDFKEIEPWSGLRPCSPDGLPYIGRSSKYTNLTVAAGHAMLGIAMGPVTGELVADIIDGKPTATDITLLHVDRYA